MLEIFNSLEPFFKENYRRINVREYARIQKISPPSASKYLEEFHKEVLLEKEEEFNYIFYKANKKNPLFISLSQMYWCQQFKKVGLLPHLEQELINPVIILFGRRIFGFSFLVSFHMRLSLIFSLYLKKWQYQYLN